MREDRQKSVLIPAKGEYISTRLHDEIDPYISKIKPLRKRQSIEISDPGPSRATNLKQIKSHVLIFSSSSGSEPDEAECTSVQLLDEPAANIFKHEPSRKRLIEEMTNTGTKAVNSKKRKTLDSSSQNLSASVFVKAEYVSAQLHEKSRTHSSKIEPSRKRRFKEISDQDPNRTVNRKQRKPCDLSLKPENLKTCENVRSSVPIRSNEELGTCMSRFGPSPLVAAIKAKNLKIFKIVYESEANPNLKECLQYAIEEDRADFVEYILKSKVNPSYCFHGPSEDPYLKNVVSGETPLHQAVRKGRVDMCQLLIFYGAELDTMNVFDETPLVTAIRANKLDLVKILLNSGANPNYEECLPLHHAIQKGSADMCKLLIYHGVELDTINVFGETPLFTAVRDNKLDLVEILLNSGANPDIGGCLNHAVTEGRADLCQLLISYDAQFDLMSVFDPTASIAGITTNKVNLVENLLKSHYDSKFRYSICVELINLFNNAKN
ncbi:putative ankyrin repeat protein RF_0381 [Artemia franciscana]|uniref:Uncharacterized protein n=1 Tax=Artemia franciscana TaxID=6661 RepID=A0AA88L2A8_ARTSF|nr:hypothetical protein QYM36_017271 [Artemia franciscana]